MLSNKSKVYVMLLNAVVACVCLVAFLHGQAHAMWYEAKGQAIILNGDKEAAKREAIVYS